MPLDKPVSGRWSRQYLAEQSWGLALTFLITGAAAIYYAASAFIVSWNVPAPPDLTNEAGTFHDTVHNSTQPYTFVANNGTRLLLGCTPNRRGSNCLERAGISMRSLSGVAVTVGYFKVTYPWWSIYRRGIPNILVTVDRGSRAVLGFDASHARLLKDREIELTTRYMWLLLVALAAFFLRRAIQIIRAKLTN